MPRKQRRRLRGEGTVYFNERLGLWVAQKYVGRKRVTAYGKTAEEALRKRAEKLGEAVISRRANPTVEEFAAYWLNWKRSHIEPETADEYEGKIKRYLVPYIGHYRMCDVTTAVLDLFYAQLSNRLSSSTLRRTHGVFRQMFKQAVIWGVIAEDPMTNVKRPSGTATPRPRLWTPEEAARFFDAIKGDWLYPLFYTAATTGLRVQELLGLQWQDIDLDAGTLSVQRAFRRFRRRFKKPKTPSSVRTIPLPPDTVAVLREYKPAGAKPSDLVFPNKEGRPFHFSSLRNAFLVRCRRAGVPPMPLKNFRHLHATLLLCSGIDLTAVANRLGHKDATTAPRHYIEVLQDMERRAAVPLDQLLRSGD